HTIIATDTIVATLIVYVWAGTLGFAQDARQFTVAGAGRTGAGAPLDPELKIRKRAKNSRGLTAPGESPASSGPSGTCRCCRCPKRGTLARSASKGRRHNPLLALRASVWPR